MYVDDWINSLNIAPETVWWNHEFCVETIWLISCIWGKNSSFGPKEKQLNAYQHDVSEFRYIRSRYDPAWWVVNLPEILLHCPTIHGLMTNCLLLLTKISIVMGSRLEFLGFIQFPDSLENIVHVWASSNTKIRQGKSYPKFLSPFLSQKIAQDASVTVEVSMKEPPQSCNGRPWKEYAEKWCKILWNRAMTAKSKTCLFFPVNPTLTELSSNKFQGKHDLWLGTWWHTLG